MSNQHDIVVNIIWIKQCGFRDRWRVEEGGVEGGGVDTAANNKASSRQQAGKILFTALIFHPHPKLKIAILFMAYVPLHLAIKFALIHHQLCKMGQNFNPLKLCQ